MRRRTTTRLPFRHVATIVTVTFIATFLVSGWVRGELEGPSASIPSLACDENLPAGSTGIGEYLNLTIHVDTLRGIEYYTPANFTIPSHTHIRVTITNYDTGSSNMSSAYSHVCGTINGTEEVNGVITDRVLEGSTGGVAHTFTITNGSYAGFNVLVPPASGKTPSTTTFDAYFATSGTYRWQCEANCGETQMSLDGQMSGLVTVT